MLLRPRAAVGRRQGVRPTSHSQGTIRAHVESGSGRSEAPPTAILQDTHSVEGDSLLKNSLYARFYPRSTVKHAVFGTSRACFVAAIGSMPTFSTRCPLLGSRVNKGRRIGFGDVWGGFEGAREHRWAR
jgi:hypothetical protein